MTGKKPILTFDEHIKQESGIHMEPGELKEKHPDLYKACENSYFKGYLPRNDVRKAITEYFENIALKKEVDSIKANSYLINSISAIGNSKKPSIETNSYKRK